MQAYRRHLNYETGVGEMQTMLRRTNAPLELPASLVRCVRISKKNTTKYSRNQPPSSLDRPSNLISIWQPYTKYKTL
ncbi:UNVERIFIED_CONTAM: hypothetical protein HHA_214545 [Hammondia hammondi]|eukprot:XP_008886733.1 hypothetical protein HHA_214545 [Hammondia hammondi]